MQSIEVRVFNVYPELATLIIQGYKTAEARETLNVHNLAVRPHDDITVVEHDDITVVEFANHATH